MSSRSATWVVLQTTSVWRRGDTETITPAFVSVAACLKPSSAAAVLRLVTKRGTQVGTLPPLTFRDPPNPVPVDSGPTERTRDDAHEVRRKPDHRQAEAAVKDLLGGNAGARHQAASRRATGDGPREERAVGLSTASAQSRPSRTTVALGVQTKTCRAVLQPGPMPRQACLVGLGLANLGAWPIWAPRSWPPTSGFPVSGAILLGASVANRQALPDGTLRQRIATSMRRCHPHDRGAQPRLACLSGRGGSATLAFRS